MEFNVDLRNSFRRFFLNLQIVKLSTYIVLREISMFFFNETQEEQKQKFAMKFRLVPHLTFRFRNGY